MLHRPDSAAPLRMFEQARQSAATAAGFYTMAAILWIGLSDRMVALFATTREQLELVQIWKGLFFVTMTGLLIYVTLRVLLHRDAARALMALQSERALAALEHQRNAELLASAIAHDVRNNLMVIRMVGAELSEDAALPPQHRAALSDLEAAAEDANALIVRLKDAWRREEPQPISTDLGAVVDRVVQLAHRHPAVRGCALRAIGEPGLRALQGFPRLIEQALLNLILNAAQAAGPEGEIEVRWAAAGDALQLSVEDNGPGVPAAVAARIFEPLFTTRAEGTGLGLVSVQLAARVHRGGVELDRSRLGGARFTLRLREGCADGATASE